MSDTGDTALLLELNLLLCICYGILFIYLVIKSISVRRSRTLMTLGYMMLNCAWVSLRILLLIFFIFYQLTSNKKLHLQLTYYMMLISCDTFFWTMCLILTKKALMLHGLSLMAYQELLQTKILLF
jgi:hypothetical protein